MKTLLTPREALAQNPTSRCPQDIYSAQHVLSIPYHDFNENTCHGQLVVHQEIAEIVVHIFKEIYALQFPIARMIPIAHPTYAWDDIRSMEDNNTSGFNYRTVAGTERLSLHAYGLAIDINPLQNPYIKGEIILPRHASYDPHAPGTLTEKSAVVQLFKSYGFTWGGDWLDRIDYQHFEYPLPKV